MTNLTYRLGYLIGMPLLLALTFQEINAYTVNPSLKDKAHQDQNYKIDGTIRGEKSGWIFLAHVDTSHKILKLDSAKVVNGKFNFVGTVSQTEHCYLAKGYWNKEGKRRGLGMEGEFILDKGTLTISCHNDSLAKLKASGTPGQNEFNTYKIKANPFYLLMNDVHGKILSAEHKKDKLLASSLRKKQLSYMNSIKNIAVNHVKAYPTSQASAIIVQSILPCLDAESLNTITTLFSDDVKNSEYGNFINKKMMAENRTALGKLAPAFALPDQFGKVVSLASYKGKITLVDFWASWCGPCRAENPNLIRAYTEYKNKSFDILSVSMDGDKSAWLRAISEDKLPWMQISDLKGTKSEMKALYGITEIPQNFLLDKDGKILARNLRGNEVQDALAKYLK